MPLHLLKLCVGIGSLAELDASINQRLDRCRTAGLPAEQAHTTRVFPKRTAEIVGGGSLFWVIRGQIAARQPVREIRPFVDADGINRCYLVLEPIVIGVSPRPCRPFQGWRYLEEHARPLDLTEADAALPEQMRLTLRELCLL